MPKMKREDVIEFLARVVNDRHITEAEAVIALKKFDDGVFPLKELPYRPEELITGITRQTVDEALA